ncbi:hypothetical protein GGF44_000366 [Coemansia sp. RSA 1694]|nr:hypothetical protein IWW47_003876 [Coemansia sp. RSA 2052]KAJ2644845.1 hypothetical protein GGF44_000366 [Coemansia sp. RSA 1694]
MTKLVAIVGATGLQGGSVLKSLHATGKYKLRALTRDPNSKQVASLKAKYPGVDWVRADLDDPASLRSAFQGANAVFGVTQFFQKSIGERVEGGNENAEFEQGKNMVDAAIAAGAESMVLSSLDSMKQLSHGKYPGVLHFEGKHKIEEYLTSMLDKIKGYFIYLGFYMENFVNYSRISPEDNKTVEFTLPLKPDSKLPLVDTANDTGAVVAYILEHPEECLGLVVEVSGGYYEPQDMAKAFTAVTGIPSRYVQIPYEYIDNDELVQMFKGQEEFGYFGGRTEFIERNKEIKHAFTTPTSFWKNRGWTGPSQ